MHYLDHACVGRPADSTLRAVREAVADLAVPCDGTARTLGWMDAAHRARQAAATLTGTRAHEIALVESTTAGLGAVAAGVLLEPGDNVLVADADFIGAAVVWRRATARVGASLRQVRTARGRATVDAFAEAADRRTRVIVVSAVQEVSGYRADLDAFASLAADRGAWLVVDAVQESGVLPRALPPDFRSS